MGEAYCCIRQWVRPPCKGFGVLLNKFSGFRRHRQLPLHPQTGDLQVTTPKQHAGMYH